jgi:hypothetical protein
MPVDTETASRKVEAPRGHGPQKGLETVDSISVPKAGRLWIARTHAPKEAIERFNQELMDDSERMVLLDRIRRLRKALAL